jgi:polysaccharide biosynthesis transport protein
MNKVVDRLKLDEDPEFNPGIESATENSVAAAVASKASKDSTGKLEAVEELDLDKMLAADSLQRSVTAFRDGLTYVISINATSEDPAKAALIANTLTSIYISGQLNTKVDETVKAGEWLQERLTELREDVRAAESAVQEFRTAQGLIQAGGVSTIESKIASLTSQLLVLQSDLSEKRLRHEEALRFADADAETAQRSDVITSPLLITLRSQRSDLAREFADVTTQYSTLHPEYIRVRNQLDELAASIEAERRRILSSLDSDVQVAQSRVNSVEAELRKLGAQLNRNNVDMIKERELEREATASRELYEDLLNRAERVTQATQLQRSDAHLVAAAEPPTRPSAPNHELNILLGALAGLALAGLVAVLFELFEKGISGSDEIERLVGLPVLTTVPNIPRRNWFKAVTADQLGQYMLTKSRSSFTEAIRNIFHIVYRAAQPHGSLAVALTSALPGEGKTTLTHCVAMLAATQSERVIVVDGDLHRRTLSLALAPNAEVGLLEVLQGTADPFDAIVPLENSHHSILPVSPKVADPNWVVTRESFERLFASLKKHYDLVVIDCPPALPVLDSRVIGAAADGLIFAARWRKTHRKAVAKALHLLQGEGSNIIGVVITRADLKAQAMYDDFGASHHKLYTAYYKD